MTEEIAEPGKQLPELPARVYGVESLDFNPRMSAFDLAPDDFNNQTPSNGYNLFVDVFIKKTGFSERNGKKRKAVWDGLSKDVQQSYTKKAEQLRKIHNLNQLGKLGEKGVLKSTNVAIPQINTIWNKPTGNEGEAEIKAKKLLEEHEKDLKSEIVIKTPLEFCDWTEIEPTFKADDDFPWTAILGEEGLAILEP